MATYLSCDTIRRLREARGLTQRALAEAIGVTDKAVSKWETGRGLPDLSLVEPLAQALGVSVAELLTGDVRTNANRSANVQRAVFYVCPLCGNVVFALGEGSFSCCGSQMLPQQAEDAAADPTHAPHVERVENDWYVTVDHPMEKGHYLSFMALVTYDGVTIRKLYPEQAAEARFSGARPGQLYLYCNRHGLFRTRIPARP